VFSFSTLGVLLCCGIVNVTIIKNTITMRDYEAVSSGSLSGKYPSGSSKNMLPNLHDPLHSFLAQGSRLW
jgi:hypothetical protein